MKHILILLVFICSFASAQNLTQTVRGVVVDTETRFPLIGASIVLTSDTSRTWGTITGADGDFRLEDVPVGRQSFKVSFVGYEDVILNNIVVSSAKEVILNVSMEESQTELAEVVVKATRDGDASNEMALVSARSFTIEETERYAGSRGDPARMASNFAGVQGADDSRNDIVIRGNSPQAVLWRLEGINIPNPNHFNIPGTAGGPVSMLNNKTLANSDFYTGAFPAEFGNSIAGVFDLSMRNGNNNRHEFSGQFGFLGTEIFAEGPLSRSRKSSYLLSYRYSTLALFSGLGIDIGTDAIPRYQDAAFKLNFPMAKNGSLSFFGVGGNSHIDIMISDQVTPERNIYGDNDRDQYFKSSAGVLGVAYKRPVSTTTYFSATLALSGDRVVSHHDYIYRHLNARNTYEVDSLVAMLDYTFANTKVSGNFFYAYKPNGKNVINAGINTDTYFFNFLDSARDVNQDSPTYNQWEVRWDSRDQSVLVQPFVQWKHSFSPRLDATLGVHSQYFSLSTSFVPLEPRLAFRYKVNDRSTFEFGTGLHSQIQPTYLYYYGTEADGNRVPTNLNMDFSRSLQVVAGYQRMLAPNLRLKTETYYQHLFNIPVEKNESSFSVVNTGAGFARFFPDTLVNEGIGRNYGVEVTLEKFFSKGYLFMVTGSLYEARYRGSDGVWRDTDFNGNYILNALFTKEWKFHNQNTIAIGGKVTTAGGRRYGPVDVEQSEAKKDVVFVDESRNSLQFDPYFRADLKINYRINRPKLTHEIAVDLVNVFDTQNVLKLTYAPDAFDPGANPVRKEYQLGRLPLFYYRVDF